MILSSSCLVLTLLAGGVREHLIWWAGITDDKVMVDHLRFMMH
jgi:hypothetical protein